MIEKIYPETAESLLQLMEEQTLKGPDPIVFQQSVQTLPPPKQTNSETQTTEVIVTKQENQIVIKDCSHDVFNTMSPTVQI